MQFKLINKQSATKGDQDVKLDMWVCVWEREYRIVVLTGTFGIIVLVEHSIATNPLASNFNLVVHSQNSTRSEKNNNNKFCLVDFVYPTRRTRTVHTTLRLLYSFSLDFRFSRHVEIFESISLYILNIKFKYVNLLNIYQKHK